VALRLRLRYTAARGPFGAGAMAGEDHLLHEILGTGHLTARFNRSCSGTPHAVRRAEPEAQRHRGSPTTISEHPTLAWSADSMDHFRSPGGLGKGRSARR
jgi:hypothetical protein